MKEFLLSLLFFASPTSGGAGMIAAHDVALGGIAIGDSPKQVRSKLGQPKAIEKSPDYLSLHYTYANVRVSFDDNVVTGLFTDSDKSCTPKGLCPGDSLDKMRKLYGEPLLTDRESGRFFEYYGIDVYCWFQIPDQGNKVSSIKVACQP
jgi:hypothetical protein